MTTGAALLLAGAAVGQPLVWPGERVSTLDGTHLRAYVPRGQARELRALAARADQLYGLMLEDSGLRPSRKLRLLLSDWEDDHNGFSFVVPFPLVQVVLAPAFPESSLFAGEGHLERTLVHELAHQVANDRNAGVRGGLAGLFGRVLPAEPLSLLLWYLSTPAHQTMPRFWQEALSMWAETEYADARSPWAGRGRDPLTHMVWRLDAEAGALPEAAQWRVTWHLWPYGNRAYVYGLAYTRYLAGLLPGRKEMWRVAAEQGAAWPFQFKNASPQLLGAGGHAHHLEQARRTLLLEQQGVLARLRSRPVTALERLTPPGWLLGAPAWEQDGSLLFAARGPHGRPRLHRLGAQGRLEELPRPAHALGGVRLPLPGMPLYHEYDWRGVTRVRLGERVLGRRMLQPDLLVAGGGGGLLAAVRLAAGGSQELVLQELDLEAGTAGQARRVPVQGRPWSPAFRPGGSELLWVETDAEGSRLVLAPLERLEERTVLLALRGRILHPAWAPGGARLFFCADHTGAANAWCLEPERQDAGRLRPVTNTLGGVIACVPSPDGLSLALVDHDREGPFLARMPADPQAWAEEVPVIELAWPAPLAGTEQRRAPQCVPALDPAAVEALEPRAYGGPAEIRPLFWTPTTLAVPEGGYGLSAMAADPLFTHVLGLGVGIGPVAGEKVGFLGYSYAALPIELGAALWRAERTFGRLAVDSAGNEFDYTERVDTLELRAGRGLAGRERSFRAFLALGLSDSEEEQASARLRRGRTFSTPAPFEGRERYLQLTLGYASTTFFPTSYAWEDGPSWTIELRHGGLGGDLERNRVFGSGSYTFSVFPEAGHQLVLAAQAGWSDGARILQGDFGVGGALGRGLPRGYLGETAATGRHLAAASAAWRFPLWRPFTGHDTGPLRSRQLVLELFGDAAKASPDRPFGEGEWFTSAGGELRMGFEFMDILLHPGLGLAKQLAGEREWAIYLTLGFPF